MPRRLIAFFVLTFVLSAGVPGSLLLLSAWGGTALSIGEFSPVSYAYVWAPAVSAFAVIAWTQGRSGVLAYARRLLRWNAGWRCYAAVLLGVPLLNLLAAALAEAAGRDALRAPVLDGSFLVLALLRATEGPMEELGWRGFALPLLQQRFSGLTAALILGFVWALWHVAPLLIGRSEIGGMTDGSTALQLLRLFTGVIATSVIMTALYNAAKGSIPVVMLFHWLANWPYPWETGADISIIGNVLQVLAAVLVVVLFGRRWLGRKNLFTEVAPAVGPSGRLRDQD